MLRLFNRTILSLRHSGLKSTLKKIIRYPRRRRNFESILGTFDGIEDRFTAIYKRNAWAFGSDESISGAGSSLAYTENLRNKLPELFNRFCIKSVFDAPCGDFHWMRFVLKEPDIQYTGGDIVAPLIETNRSKYENQRIKFIHVDLTKDAFPVSDLMICRDCLFHLSFHDTKLLLNNFISSGTRYLLATTHINIDNFANKDISTGDYRLIDLFALPYAFPRNVAYRIEDWKEPDPPRELCLWTRDQVIEAMATFNQSCIQS
jgi:hypothetical protein